MRARKLIFLLTIIILITGVCGCMQNQNEEEKVENMKSYASNKYDREFTVHGFQAARDETYTNILTLSDGYHIFNVYQSGDSEASDDYPLAIVNKKLTEVLKENTNCGHDVFANFIFANGDNITLDYAKNSKASTIVAEYPLLKVVVVVAVDKNISDCSQNLFSVYKEVMAFDPKYIDFEVVQVNKISSSLGCMLKNLPAFYDSNWEKYPEVISHLSITDTNIKTADELVKGWE